MYRANISRVPAGNAAKGPGLSAPEKRHHVNRRFCRTSQYQPPGSAQVGLSANNQPSKIVWELDYGLTEVQFQALSKRFPGIAFVQTGIGCHDHPIAHTSYRVVWENVIKMLRPGQLVADVSGNPQYNEQFNRAQKGRNAPIQVDTFCKVMSTKDSIRAKTRWGPKVAGDVTRWEEMTLYDMYRNDENRQRFAKYDVFLMNHVLYYYKMSEINRLLALNPDSVLIATLHKLNGQSGEINCGEQRYEKDMVTGKVVQTNVETCETYTHGDPAPWFQNFSYADEHGAFAWTVNKGCDDTYIVTATSTDPKLVEESCWLDGKIICRNQFDEQEVIYVTSPESAEPPPAYGVEEVVLKSGQLFGDSGGSKELRIKITHPELFRTLKHFMINKPRNVRTLQDLTAKAHREVGNNKIGGGPKVDITDEALTKHIAAAWAAGVKLEDECFAFAHAQAGSMSAVNRNLAGGSLVVTRDTVVKQVVRFAALTNGVLRSHDRPTKVLEQLEQLL